VPTLSPAPGSTSCNGLGESRQGSSMRGLGENLLQVHHTNYTSHADRLCKNRTTIWTGTSTRSPCRTVLLSPPWLLDKTPTQASRNTHKATDTRYGIGISNENRATPQRVSFDPANNAHLAKGSAAVWMSHWALLIRRPPHTLASRNPGNKARPQVPITM
jgi:hypothetical protein